MNVYEFKFYLSFLFRFVEVSAFSLPFDTETRFNVITSWNNFEYLINFSTVWRSSVEVTRQFGTFN